MKKKVNEKMLAAAGVEDTPESEHALTAHDESVIEDATQVKLRIEE